MSVAARQQGATPRPTPASTATAWCAAAFFPAQALCTFCHKRDADPRDAIAVNWVIGLMHTSACDILSDGANIEGDLHHQHSPVKNRVIRGNEQWQH
jgi:hypothetical protein